MDNMQTNDDSKPVSGSSLLTKTPDFGTDGTPPPVSPPPSVPSTPPHCPSPPLLPSFSTDYLSRPRLQSSKEDNKDKLIEKILLILSIFVVVITFPFSLFCVFVVVRQFERIVILRHGKVHKNRAFGPGLIFYLPCIDNVKYTDLRINCYTVPPQECLTKDSLSVTVQAVIYYKVFDPLWAVINVSNFKLSTQFLAATILRNTVSSRKLSQLLKNRSDVSDYVLQRMKRLTFEWGISVIRTEIKDISLPLQLQKAMAAEAESSRLANAKIIVASSEIASTKSLQQATVMLMDNPWCMQLRYLQSLHMIAGPQTHTVVFPYSVDLIKKLFSDNDNNK
ncbi:stomatin-like [Choristoneura fumiferana]|uniref:stomatin-like n=1 Tax=Choristoneura fumiferana TaxID=7141 RepID=UPI003D15B0A4